MICKTRSRIRQALNENSKSISTKKFLGTDIDTYRKWIEWQMTPEMNWTNIEIEHVKDIRMFDISDNEEQNLHSIERIHNHCSKFHSEKGTKFNFIDYQLQFIRAYQFLKLNEV